MRWAENGGLVVVWWNVFKRTLMISGVIFMVGHAVAADIRATKHNLSENKSVDGKLDERQICVFCHTPEVDIGGGLGSRPLGDSKLHWQSSLAENHSFVLYDDIGRRGLGKSSVGSQSIACLSCHDAVQAFAATSSQADHPFGVPYRGATLGKRESGAWQRENQLSDGTLRLIGLLWSLMEGNSLLLLEEPELSLNEEIVRHLPKVIRRIQIQSKTARQVLITTHSEALLSDQSIPPEEVLRLETTSDGTQIKPLDEQEKIMLATGLSVAEVLLASVKPAKSDQLHLALA